MVQHQPSGLDAAFAALADATRRGVLETLGEGEASISALADRFQMTLTGMKKHIGVLEQAGFVATEKVGRVRTCRLGPQALDQPAAWIEARRRLWAQRLDGLEEVVAAMKRKEDAHGRTRE